MKQEKRTAKAERKKEIRTYYTNNISIKWLIYIIKRSMLSYKPGASHRKKERAKGKTKTTYARVHTYAQK